MRLAIPYSSLALLCIAACSFLLSGCDQKPEATGPEMGSVEAYLEAHPEERMDDPDEAGDESEEFDASGG